jgi:hypothetical protein
MQDRTLLFEARARHIKDNGADFEDFVFECFRYAREEAGFVKRLAAGRDGAIDLVDRVSEPGAATIAECKYIGSGQAAEAVTRWRAVARNLAANLPALAKNPSLRPGSPYRGWLDPHRPVTRYRFCVTCRMTDSEVRALEAEIARDFARIVADVPQVAALASNLDANVRVLRWDWFAKALNDAPSLAFRWFRGLPVGVDLFEPEIGGEATFRDFLRSGELRYLSREEYDSRGFGRIERRESELIAALTSGDRQALLITGPGGAGKTRLSWELAAALAGSDHGFDVYRLGRGAGFASVDELARHYPADGSILLLLDYAEAASDLARVADAVEHVTRNSGHRLCLVATCRASAANQVRDALGVLALEEKSLGSARSGESDFVHWVARSILELEALPSPEQIEKVCRGVPALAAFAVFLHRRHPDRFDTQFGALLQVDDFEKWAAHRISALVDAVGGSRGDAEPVLARIAIALPMPAQRLDAIGAEDAVGRSLIRMLRDDRWIEHEAGQYFAAHDVLADALAARWIFEADSAVTDRVGELLGGAVDADEFERCLIALERLASHPKFGEIEGGRLIDELVALRPNDVAGALSHVIASQMLSVDEKLQLFQSHALLRERARADRAMDIPLSALAEQCAKQGLGRADARVATLLDLIEHALSYEHGSNIVLRRGYALDPDRFRERAYRNLADFPGNESTHFLLVQMLRSGEPRTALEGHVVYWAQCNATSIRASFLFRQWLKDGGSTAPVEAPLLAWVAEHGQTPEAQFVYAAWLDAGGRIEPIEAPLLAWMAEHGRTIQARFVYSAWLEAKGSIKSVQAPLLAWLAEHGQMFEASFIYRSWLDAKGPVEAVETPLLAWVAEHGQTPEASFVYRGWLEAKGPRDAIETPLLAWVAEHGRTLDAQSVYAAWLDAEGPVEAVEAPLLAWVADYGQTLEARFVYAAWLDATGRFDAVEAPLLAWLAEHGQTPEASFVYRPWLDANGRIEAVEAPLLSWVAEHGAVREASHVYRAWSKRGGNFDAVRQQIYAWVEAWYDEPDAVFVTRHLVKRPDLPDAVVLAIARWSVAFAGHEDSLDRLATLLAHAREETLSEAGFLQLISLTEDAVTASLDHDCLSSLERSRLWAISSSLSHGHLFVSNPHGCVRTFAKIVRSNRVFVSGLDTGGADFLLRTYDRLLIMALIAVRWGELSTRQDARALRAFVGWLRVRDPGIEGWRRLLED